MKEEMLNTALEALASKGYNVNIANNVKNGVTFTGVQVHIPDEQFAPVIYPPESLTNVDEVVKFIEDVIPVALQEFKQSCIQDKFNRILTDEKEFLNAVRMGLQKDSEESIVKSPTEFEGIEKYLYLCIEEKSGKIFTTKLTKQLLEKQDVSEEMVWHQAEKNTFAEGIITTMSEKMYIVSSRDHIKGAVQVLNKNLLRKLSKETNAQKFVMLPSSTEEVILIPMPPENDLDLDVMSELVANANDEAVEQKNLILSNQAYLVDVPR